MAEKVRVKILKHGFIPGVGNGPLYNPIYLSIEKYEQLKRLGYDMEIVDGLEFIDVKESKKETVTEEKQEEVKDEFKETEKIIEKEKKENLESEEVDFIEVVENDPNINADSFYTKEFLTTKNVCKKILDARQIMYKDSDNFNTLVNKVLESNPEVEEE